MCVYGAEVNINMQQGQASQMHSSQSHNASYSSAVTVLLQEYGVNRAQSYFPRSRPIETNVTLLAGQWCPLQTHLEQTTETLVCILYVSC
jgi:hypothetical protein